MARTAGSSSLTPRSVRYFMVPVVPMVSGLSIGSSAEYRSVGKAGGICYRLEYLDICQRAYVKNLRSVCWERPGSKSS